MILNTGINYTPSLKQNFKASLLAQMMKNSNVQQNTAPAAAPVSQNQGLPLSNPAHIPVTTPVADKYVQTMAKNSIRQNNYTKITINRRPVYFNMNSFFIAILK